MKKDSLNVIVLTHRRDDALLVRKTEFDSLYHIFSDYISEY